MNNKACFRSLRNYKYQLTEDYGLEVGIAGFDIDHPYMRLTPSGQLIIRKGYAWDGPSGPTVDTLNFMRGSLVHDVLYQMIQMGSLDSTNREHADNLLKQICLEDGMSRFRAWYVHKAVRNFGAMHAKPSEPKTDDVTCIPVSQ